MDNTLQPVNYNLTELIVSLIAGLNLLALVVFFILSIIFGLSALILSSKKADPQKINRSKKLSLKFLICAFVFLAVFIISSFIIQIFGLDFSNLTNCPPKGFPVPSPC